MFHLTTMMPGVFRPLDSAGIGLHVLDHGTTIQSGFFRDQADVNRLRSRPSVSPLGSRISNLNAERLKRAAAPAAQPFRLMIEAHGLLATRETVLAFGVIHKLVRGLGVDTAPAPSAALHPARWRCTTVAL